MTLQGLRVLVVEDETAVAMMVEAMLESLGCVIADSAWRLAQAMELAQRSQIDVAILDVNLAGERVFPVAEILRARGIPFMFATGYGASGVPAEFLTAPVLPKPFRQEDLQQVLATTFTARGIQPSPG